MQHLKPKLSCKAKYCSIDPSHSTPHVSSYCQTVNCPSLKLVFLKDPECNQLFIRANDMQHNAKQLAVILQKEKLAFEKRFPQRKPESALAETMRLALEDDWKSRIPQSNQVKNRVYPKGRDLIKSHGEW